MHSTPAPQESIDLQRYWSILKRRWLPATGVLAITLAVTAGYTLLQKPVYEAEGQLVLKRTSSTSALTGLAEKQGELDTVSNQGSPLDTEIEILRSSPIAQDVIGALGLKDEDSRPLKIGNFLKKLGVQNLSKTDLLRVSYRSTEPEEAAAVVNKVIDLYVQNNILINRAETTAARKFIESQLPKTEATVRQAEMALRQFNEQNRIVDLSEEARSAVRVNADLESDIARAGVGLQEATAQAAAFRQQLGVGPREALAMGTLGQAPAVQKVLEEYQQVESQLAVQRTRYQEDHPAIQTLKAKEAALARLLKERIKQVLGEDAPRPTGGLQFGDLKQNLTEAFVKAEVSRLGLTNRLAALTAVRDSIKERVAALPRLEQGERQLMRTLKAAQTTYEGLLQKLQEVRVAENQKVGNARVVVRASASDEPVAPRESQNFAVGGLLGILLALGTAAILEARDRTIKTVREAKQAFSYPVLAGIPAFSKELRPSGTDPATSLIVRDSPRHPISEVFRMLQTNLKFLSSDEDLKAIVIASSVAQEGKSTVAANLAVAIAQVGRRVLLVDCDLRSPDQHKIWNLEGGIGLSNVLAGQAELEGAILPVGGGLDVLPAGVLPPNPVALIDSRRMAGLMALFTATYDLVIFDTPPITSAADALILGKLASGVLLVIRPGVVDIASAASAREALQQSGQTVLGQVINGIIPANEPDSYYYYKGYYGEKPASALPPSVVNGTRGE